MVRVTNCGSTSRSEGFNLQGAGRRGAKDEGKARTTGARAGRVRSARAPASVVVTAVAIGLFYDMDTREFTPGETSLSSSRSVTSHEARRDGRERRYRWKHREETQGQRNRTEAWEGKGAKSSVPNPSHPVLRPLSCHKVREPCGAIAVGTPKDE